MNALSRSDAQRRADDIHTFTQELGRLEQESVLVLSDAQRQALRQHHDRLLAEYAQAFDIDRDARSRQLSLGMRIASFLGALALAASIFFLFYQLWGLLPTSAQVTLLLAASLGTLAATYVIQRRDATGYFTKLAAMVAFACFVLNIALLGQIFNITPSDKALIPWAALAFLLAYTCDLRLLLAFGILCVIAFISARTGTWSGMYWIHFGQRPENFFPAAAILFFAPSVISHARLTGFGSIYRVFGLLTLLLPVLVLSHWGAGSYLALTANFIEGMYQTVGFVVSAAVIGLGVRRHWPEVVNTGITFFVIFLYTKFYDWWWELMPKYLFFLLVGLTAVLFLALMKRVRADGYRVLGGAA